MDACECQVYPRRASQITDNDRVPDGKVCLNDMGELAVTKVAVEPVSLPYTRLT